MATKVGINGFGRIGRQVFKAIRDTYGDSLEVVAVNDIGDVPTMAHLLKYDTVFGRVPGEIVVADGYMSAGGHKVKMLEVRDPADLPWAELGVDVVFGPVLDVGAAPGIGNRSFGDDAAVDDLSFRYPDGTPALHHVNLHIHPGERVATGRPLPILRRRAPVRRRRPRPATDSREVARDRQDRQRTGRVWPGLRWR